MQKRSAVYQCGKWGLLALIPLLLFSLLWNMGSALATAPHGYRPFALVPDTLQCFDIGYLTPDDYYLANATEKRIDHIDLEKNKPWQLHVDPLNASGFTGNGDCLSFDYSHMGPAGVLMDSRHQLWAANGDSSLLLFSPDHQVTHLSTGGTRRADEMTLDTRRGVLVVTNPDEQVPFLSFVDIRTHTIIKKLFFPQATGLEQPVWIRGNTAQDDRFYLSVPATRTHPNGEIARIDAASRTVIGTYPLITPCHPTGLVMGMAHTLAIGCDTGPDSLLLNLSTGITRPVVGAGQTDVVAYDRDTQHYSFARYAGQGQVVVADERGQVTQIIPTAPGAHTVTAGHGWLLIPETGKGIAVFTYA